jgi:hypothetical protein
MCKISFRVWIANAAARLRDQRGSVTTQAQQANCSRQTVYDHAQKGEAAVAAEHGGGPTHEEMDRELAAVRTENAQLWDWLDQTIEFPMAKQQMFAAKGIGLSHSQVHDLLAWLLGARACPSRSTIHRWVQAAGKAAGVILQRLDGGCRVLVLVGCLDEIFFHRDATAPTPDRPSAAGSGVGCLPHQEGSPRGLECPLEPGGAALGTG